MSEHCSTNEVVCDYPLSYHKSEYFNDTACCFDRYPKYGGRVEHTDPYSPGKTQSDNQTASGLNLDDEVQRIRTFYNWPSSAPVTPYELAKWGFIYMKTGDRVKCVYCAEDLYNWQRGDKVFDEHKRISPYCPIIVKETLRSSPGGVDDPIPPKSRKSSSVSHTQSCTKTSISIRSIDFSPTTAKYPQFKEINKRVRSYSQPNWPSNIIQTPLLLSECGFFYTGERDKVKCFVCAGNLQGWEESDDPWAEHVKWYPHCELVRHFQDNKITKADVRTVPEASVRTVPEASVRTVPESSVRTTLSSRGASSTFSGNAPPGAAATTAKPQQSAFTDREIRARFDTQMVQTVLNQGFSKDTVKKAIERQLRTKGDDFPNAASLLQAVFDIDSEGAQTTPSGTTGQGEFRQVEFSGPGIIDLNEGHVSQPVGGYGVTRLNVNTKGQQGYHSAGSSTTTSLSAPGITIDISGLARPKINFEKIPNASQNRQDMKSLEEELSVLKEQRLCKICMDVEADVVFVPCGHFVACSKCTVMLQQCPVCRQHIQKTVKTFVS